jgi:Zn-dependent protease
MDILLIILVALMPAIVLHEFAHGWVAYKLGDPTAKELGRLSLNPIKHIDPIGTILLPAVIFLLRFLGLTSLPAFALAKPVPVNFERLRQPKQDMIWVALAGPGINIVLAFIFGIIWNIGWLPAFRDIIAISIFVNIGLATFNMIPIPPLDGGRVLVGILPKGLSRIYSKVEPFGIVLVVLLLSQGFLRFLIPVVYTAAGFIGADSAIKYLFIHML